MYYEIEARLNMKPIIFDDDGITVGEKLYPYAEIEKVEITSGPLFSTFGMLNLWADGKKNLIPFPRQAAEKIRRALREMEKLQEESAETQTETPSPAAPPPPAMDPYEEAKKLKELLDLGIITEEEFQRKKKEILGL